MPTMAVVPINSLNDAYHYNDQSDPYKYQLGFGNHHVTEAIPEALPPPGTNLPQRGRYGLYAEHLNGTPFISPRDTVANVQVQT